MEKKAISLPDEAFQVQTLLRDFQSDAWEKCWEKGLTPWEMGKPNAIILHLLQTNGLPKGRALVPGCGSGYDVEAMANPDRYVIGLDIAESSTKKSIEMFSASPNRGYFTFLAADFFTWHPDELFDFIFDCAFFCCIEPKLRSAWAQRCKELLKPNGELIALIFPISDHVGGPPYGVSVSEYEDVLHPLGFKEISVADNEFAEGKKGEKIGRWKLI